MGSLDRLKDISGFMAGFPLDDTLGSATTRAIGGMLGTIALEIEREREETDSWERLEEDAGKGFIEYWGCSGVGCENCPSKVDGVTPRDRYQCSCAGSVALDIVRRAKELAGASE